MLMQSVQGRHFDTDREQAIQPYRHPMPAYCLPEIVIPDAIPQDERLWVPQQENVWFRPLCLSASHGYWTSKARELLLTGDLLSADEAQRLGAVGHVVPAEELDARVDKIVAKLRNGATKAIRWTKAGYTIPLRQLAHGHMDAGVAYECLTNLTQDHNEAIEAFAAKRKPVFTGR